MRGTGPALRLPGPATGDPRLRDRDQRSARSDLMDHGSPSVRRPDLAARPYLVVVDPQVALFRYLEVARRKGYRTLVLALDPHACRSAESKHNRETPSKASTPDSDPVNSPLSRA